MNLKNKKPSKKLFIICIYGLAFIGFVFVFVFIAMQFGWLNVKGSISERNSYFSVSQTFFKNNSDINNFETVCRINVLNKYAPLTSVNIYKTLLRTGDNTLVNQMVNSASRRFSNDYEYTKYMEDCVDASKQSLNIPISAYSWAETDQWNLMKEVFVRDQDVIKRAATDAGISPRLILGGVIGEQFRFFNSRREVFKSYFEPLKILASLSQISFGIAGIKPKTAMQIEEHLKDKNSPFYLGKEMEHVLDYSPLEYGNIEEARMERITNTKNPYYSYLYVGLYMRQIEAQWQRAGYDISRRPDVFATLYNLGFYYSSPKSNPEAGGATININDVDYTFGDLGYEFYFSGELSDTFPFGV